MVKKYLVGQSDLAITTWDAQKILGIVGLSNATSGSNN